MEYIECEPVQGVGYCSDNDCPCTVTQIPPGEGYLYISPEVVEFRKDALTREAVQKKLAPLIAQGESISIMQYEPVLVCKQGARQRNLDLDIAAEDAKQWWESHIAPLRATPLASEEAREQSDLNDMEASVREKIQADSLPKIDPASTSDVLSNFAGTPLAELAAKMADDTGPQSDSDYVTTDTAIPLDSKQYSTNDTLAIPEPPPAASEKKRKKSKKKSKAPLIIALILIGIIGGISFVLIKYLDILSLLGDSNDTASMISKPVRKKERAKPKPVEKVKKSDKKEGIPPPVKPIQGKKPSPPPTELTPAFFKPAYTFKDEQYHGTIRFMNITAETGVYDQKVFLTGKDKVFQLSGTLKYTPRQITFRPDGADVDVIWKLQSLNSDGYSAIFYDPQKVDNAEARIYLKACKTKDCK